MDIFFYCCLPAADVCVFVSGCVCFGLCILKCGTSFNTPDVELFSRQKNINIPQISDWDHWLLKLYPHDNVPPPGHYENFLSTYGAPEIQSGDSSGGGGQKQ